MRAAKHALLRHAFCLSTGRQLEPTALMVKGNAQFCTEVAGCSEDELREFEKESTCSSTARGSEV